MFVSGALLLSILMAALFVFAQATVIYRDLAVDCGCFQLVGGQEVGYATIARTGVLFIVSLLAYLWVVFGGAESSPRVTSVDQPEQNADELHSAHPRTD